MIPEPLVEDERPSSQGFFLVGALVVAGVLLWLVLGQLASDEAVAPLDAGLSGVPATSPGSLGSEIIEEPEQTQPTQTQPTQTQPTQLEPTTTEPTTAAPPTTGSPSDSSESEISEPGAELPGLADGTDPAMGPVELIGDPLEPVPAEISLGNLAADPMVGSLAPELRGLDFDNNEVSVSVDGRAKVIIFVAHWCPHCQKEVPQIVLLHEAGLLSEDVDVYAVSTAVDESRGNYPPGAWLEDERWPFPVIRDNDVFELLDGFGGTGFPFAVFLDGDHRVVARTVGSLDVDQMLYAWGLLAE